MMVDHILRHVGWIIIQLLKIIPTQRIVYSSGKILKNTLTCVERLESGHFTMSNIDFISLC